MKILLRTLQIIYFIYSVFAFAVSLLLVMPFILALAPLRRRKWAGDVIFFLGKIWAGLWYFLIAIKCRPIYKGPLDKKKQYIFVCNHVGCMDIPPIYIGLRNSVRILGKHEMRKIPLFGWVYRYMVIMVERNVMFSRAKSIMVMKKYLEIGCSLFIFPEGTFNGTAKPLTRFYNGAFSLAAETGIPIKPIILPDSLKRMDYPNMINTTPGQHRMVFLDTVPTQGLTQKDVPELKKKVYDMMERSLLEYRKEEK